MFPSEVEVEARLCDLRRERDRIDRLIADHALYLELGRRLPGPSGAPPADPSSVAGEERAAPSASASASGWEAGPADDGASMARRRGRALVAAVADILDEAGRPLHAGEIHDRVVARGLTVPGPDPVAALNTRLWKRSGPGGPFRRLGDAVYTVARSGEAAAGDGDESPEE